MTDTLDLENEVEQALSDLNINVPESFDITDATAAMDAAVTQAFKDVDQGTNLCVHNSDDSPDTMILYCSKSGWWREAKDFDIAQELRRTFAEPLSKAQTALEDAEASAKAHADEKNDGEAAKAKKLAVFLKSLVKEYGSWMAWTPYQRALTSRLLVLPVMQVGEMQKDGIRCGDLWVDTDTLADPRPVTKSERRLLRGGANISTDENVRWEDTGPWYDLLSAQFGDTTSEEFRCFTEVLGWSVFYDTSGTKLWVHLVGKSGAGKSVFTKKLMPMLTETAHITNNGLSGSDHFGLAPLGAKPNARAVCGEGEVDRHVDASILKNLVSGLGVVVRPMRQAPIQVDFIGTFFSDSNEFPSVSLDTGMKRRMFTVPFNHEFKGAPDNNLFAKYEAFAPSAMRLLLHAYRNLRQRAIDEDITVIEALDVPDTFKSATEEMQQSGARFMSVSDWMSVEREGPGILVPQSVLHRLISELDMAMSNSRNQFNSKTIKSGLEASGRVVYYHDAERPGEKPKPLRVRIPGTTTNHLACRIWPDFNEEVTAQEDVAGILDLICGADSSATMKMGAVQIGKDLNITHLTKVR